MDTLPRNLPDRPAGRQGAGALVDVETTGLDPRRHEVLELACILFAYDRETGAVTGILDEYAGFREPARPIPRQATAIHGITLAMVQGQRLDLDRIGALLARAEFIIAHNAAFDAGFVCPLCPEAAAKPWLCSMLGINWEQHGCGSRGLQHLLGAHGIRPEAAHRAGADCRAALALLARRGRHGQTYLRELLSAGFTAGADLARRRPG